MAAGDCVRGRGPNVVFGHGGIRESVPALTVPLARRLVGFQCRHFGDYLDNRTTRREPIGEDVADLPYPRNRGVAFALRDDYRQGRRAGKFAGFVRPPTFAHWCEWPRLRHAVGDSHVRWF